MPTHVAVIMDGNGRWARERGLPRHLGHREGMKAVRETVEGAVEAGVEILTLFAFSTENWKRPAREVSALMGLLQLYARKEGDELRRQGVEVHVLGDLDRVDDATRAAVDEI
ncbi:MAG: polyprenyl diphosphate synthase, partial [Longimicrobiales bacterium]|nr:polyprenyl diphosphate synthase [Longimicrobiales bacterium]